MKATIVNSTRNKSIHIAPTTSIIARVTVPFERSFMKQHTPRHQHRSKDLPVHAHARPIKNKAITSYYHSKASLKWGKGSIKRRTAFEFNLAPLITPAEQRTRRKKRERAGIKAEASNASSVIKTRWNTSVNAINLTISHSLPACPPLPLPPPPHPPCQPPMLLPCFGPSPRYIFSFPLIREIGTSPFATADDLFYYLVDLLAATVYWNPRRSEIMSRADLSRCTSVPGALRNG